MNFLNSACHTAEGADRIVKDVTEQASHPRIALREMVVILRGEFANFRQIPPGDVWKIMVLVMVAHIVGEPVQWTIVGVGLSCSLVDVVFGNEVASGRMDGASEERGEEQIQYCRVPEPCIHQAIEREHNNPIHGQPTAVRNEIWLYEH